MFLKLKLTVGGSTLINLNNVTHVRPMEDKTYKKDTCFFYFFDGKGIQADINFEKLCSIAKANGVSLLCE
jgi:hypothetical protein